MLKKRLYIALSIFVFCLCSTGLRAQVTFTLTEAIITGQTDQSQTGVASGQFSGFGLGGGDIWVKATTPNTNIPVTTGTSGTFLPLNIARLKLNRITGINLGTIKPEITLSTTDQSIASNGVSLGGAMYIDYRLVIAGTTWQAGSYNVPLTFSASDGTPRYYTVVVPAYLTKTTNVAATATLTVASLADFRTNGISTAQTFAYNTSVPTDISLKAGPAAISFNSNGIPNSGTPLLVPSALSSVLSGSFAGSQINLSTTDQTISTSSGVPVQTNNTSGTFTNTFKVTPASLQANFVQAGSYVYPLTYTVSKTTAAYPTSLGSQTMATTATIVIPRLFEAIIPTTGLNLSFTTPANYTSGVTVAMPSPIAISSTTPYNVTVRASSDFTLAGTTIPATAVILEGISTQTGVSSLSLSTTAQTLISSSAAVIDRNVYLQFRVPNTQTSNLLNKPAGQYSADVVFTVTAP